MEINIIYFVLLCIKPVRNNNNNNNNNDNNRRHNKRSSMTFGVERKESRETELELASMLELSETLK